jgi:hypothetical protein
MGSRRPKPTALKERTSVRSNLGLSRLFSAANALVPFKSTEPPKLKFTTVPKGAKPSFDDQTLKIDDQLDDQLNKPLELEVTRATNVKPLPPFSSENLDQRSGEPSEYGTAIIVSKKKKRKPAASTNSETKTQPIHARTSITTLKKADEKKRELSTKMLALCFIVPAICLFSYAIFSSDINESLHTSTARQSMLTPEQIKERLAYHRAMTGARLNRQRIDVQIQNYRQSPEIAFDAHKIKAPSMMDGLPLVGEQINTGRTVKKDLPYDPSYSEAHIAYGLQEEQNRVEFERQAQKQWVKDFVENARKDGYDVKIDEFGNVKAKVIPLEQRGPLPDESSILSNH